MDYAPLTIWLTLTSETRLSKEKEKLTKTVRSPDREIPRQSGVLYFPPRRGRRP
jgi:hypothetical protein